ncbi:arsenate reductase/protein-tyrosine-phosphatase family protein [Microlunatus endophyticus]
MLAARLAGTRIRVTSAGIGALVGSAMEPRVARRVVEAGGQADGFVARQLTPQLVGQADLILCASREHRAAVVRMEPAVLQRTFALADFAQLATAIQRLPAQAAVAPAGGPTSAVARLVGLVPLVRATVSPLAAGAAGIIDPYRRSDRTVARMVRQIEELLGPVEAALRGAVSAEESAGDAAVS